MGENTVIQIMIHLHNEVEPRITIGKIFIQIKDGSVNIWNSELEKRLHLTSLEILHARFHINSFTAIGDYSRQRK